jgi:hypothetical protein
MKRENVAIDEDSLEEAVRISGERTYSRMIERAPEGIGTSAWIELFRRGSQLTLDQLVEDRDLVVRAHPLFKRCFRVRWRASV